MRTRLSLLFLAVSACGGEAERARYDISGLVLPEPLSVMDTPPPTVNFLAPPADPPSLTLRCDDTSDTIVHDETGRGLETFCVNASGLSVFHHEESAAVGMFSAASKRGPLCLLTTLRLDDGQDPRPVPITRILPESGVCFVRPG